MSGRNLNPMLLNVLLLLTVSSLVSSNQKGDAQQATNVRVNIPNFFNFIPNIEKVVTDQLKSGIEAEKARQQRGDKHGNPLVHSLEQTMENYGKIREVLNTALGGRSELFTLDLKKVGEKTKLEASMPFADISVKSREENAAENSYSSTESPSEASTEVPFHVYLNDLMKLQGRTLKDLDVAVRVGQDSNQNGADGSSPESAAENQQIEVDVSSQYRRVPLTSRSRIIRRIDATNQNDLSRFGDTEMEPNDDDQVREQTDDNDQTAEDQESEDDQQETEGYDPEEEYVQDMDQQRRQYFQIMGYSTEMPTDVEVEETEEYERQVYQNDQESQKPGTPIFVQRDPVKRMADYYYVMNRNQRASESEQEPEVYEEYIDDIEGITGHLSEDSKSKLRSAFTQFKSSLDQVEFGNNVDLNQILQSEQESHNYWLPRRTIDQRDLEIAFTNINKETNVRPNPGDRMVLAFTLAGVPLKIYLDGEIENPIGYLHQVLSDAGVTLNIPVHSFADMEPIGGEVLYVGAGNRGKQVTQAMSLLIPRVEDIKKYIGRFLKDRKYDPELVEEISSRRLAESLHESLSSAQQVNFSDSLLENYRRNPVQVLVDIINFLNQSQGNESDSENEQEHMEVEVEIQEQVP